MFIFCNVILLCSSFQYTGVTKWRTKSEPFQEFYKMYTLQPCRHCNEVYKNCLPGVHIMHEIVITARLMAKCNRNNHSYGCACLFTVKVIYVLMSQFSYESSRLCWKRKTRRDARLLLGKHPSRVLQWLVHDAGGGITLYNSSVLFWKSCKYLRIGVCDFWLTFFFFFFCLLAYWMYFILFTRYVVIVSAIQSLLQM